MVVTKTFPEGYLRSGKLRRKYNTALLRAGRVWSGASSREKDADLLVRDLKSEEVIKLIGFVMSHPNNGWIVNNALNGIFCRRNPTLHFKVAEATYPAILKAQLMHKHKKLIYIRKILEKTPLLSSEANTSISDFQNEHNAVLKKITSSPFQMALKEKSDKWSLLTFKLTEQNLLTHTAKERAALREAQTSIALEMSYRLSNGIPVKSKWIEHTEHHVCLYDRMSNETLEDANLNLCTILRAKLGESHMERYRENAIKKFISEIYGTMHFLRLNNLNANA
jgi:hypothetical protein